MLYVFYNAGQKTRIVDKTTFTIIQDFVSIYCDFTLGIVPDFTQGTKLYGILNGQFLKIFNFLSTTAEIYYPVPSSMQITNVQDVGGNISKLILTGFNGDIYCLDVA
jgi:hypothetical protein